MFRSSGRGRNRNRFTEQGLSHWSALQMAKRRTLAAGLPPEIGNHSFRAAGITEYMRNGGAIETAARIAGHESTHPLFSWINGSPVVRKWCNYESLVQHIGALTMPRQSISLTEPNAEWVKAQIDSKEYTSMSDAVNDLIRQARRHEDEKIEKIRAMLIEAEQSVEKYGHSTLTPEERLDTFKEKAKARGLL